MLYPYVKIFHWLNRLNRRQMASKRIKFPYGAYPTPALGYIGVLNHKASEYAWVQAYEKNIRYHATWRAHLYFLLLLAYFEQNREVLICKTTLQHGIGVYPHLEACHSSLFPAIQDIDLYHSSQPRPSVSLIHNSFLMHWNNMTVCCPKLVNRVDQFFEGGAKISWYRQQWLRILTQGSLSKHDPIAALQEFFKIMEIAFAESDSLLEKIAEPSKKAAAKRILSIQQEGLFRTVSNDNFLPKKQFYTCLIDRKPYEPLHLSYQRTQAKLLTTDIKYARNFLNSIHNREPLLKPEPEHQQLMYKH